MNSVGETSKAVHNDLVQVLAKVYPETVSVIQASDPASGLVKYGYQDVGLCCEARVCGNTTRTASVCVSVRLGRVYVGYRHALRWLACNRSSNSVAIMTTPEAHANKELWVHTNRVTFPGDVCGIREVLEDVRTELERLQSGLYAWFPQMLHGGMLADLEDCVQREQNPLMLAFVNSPVALYQWLVENPNEMERLGAEVGVHVFGCLARWEEHLVWLDRYWDGVPDESRDTNAKAAYFGKKAVALAQLQRAAELLALAEEVEALVSEEEWASSVTMRARALYQLRQYDEVLETLQAARFDTNPRAWFWRSLAQARLGQQSEALDAFFKYEQHIGTDILGRREITEALAE